MQHPIYLQYTFNCPIHHCDYSQHGFKMYLYFLTTRSWSYCKLSLVHVCLLSSNACNLSSKCNCTCSTWNCFLCWRLQALLHYFQPFPNNYLLYREHFLQSSHFSLDKIKCSSNPLIECTVSLRNMSHYAVLLNILFTKIYIYITVSTHFWTIVYHKST